MRKENTNLKNWAEHQFTMQQFEVASYVWIGVCKGKEVNIFEEIMAKNVQIWWKPYTYRCKNLDNLQAQEIWGEPHQGTP